MPTTTYIAPNIGTDRSGCLAVVNSSTELITASYEQGYVYNYDGNNLVAIGSTFPSIFGSWLYPFFGGDTPAAPPNGSMQFLDGATGGISWTTTAFTGGEAILIQVADGGLAVANPFFPVLDYPIVGNEVFTCQVQVVDTTPSEILLGFYAAGSFRYVWWTHTIDFFGFPGTDKGSFSSAVGSWIELTFTAADMNLLAGESITGITWGVYSPASSVIFSDTFSSNGGTQTLTQGRFIDCAPDGSTGFYVLGHSDDLYHFANILSAPITTALPNQFTQDYRGVNLVGSSVFVLRSDGTVFKLVGSSLNSFATPTSGITTPAKGFYNDGTLLYTLFAGNNVIGTINATSAAYSTIATPFGASTETFYVSGTAILAGGSEYISLTSTNNNFMAYSVAATTLITVNTSGNTVNMWTIGNGQWTSASTHSVSGTPQMIVTTGLQALISNPASSGSVVVFTDTLGTWASVSVSGITSAAGLAVTPDGTKALVTQGTHNTVQVLNNSAGTWGIGQIVTGITNPTSVAISLTGNKAITNNSTGVTFLTYNTVDWILGNSLVVSPVPTIVCTDVTNPNLPSFYAAATSGGTTAVSIFGPVAGVYTLTSTVSVSGTLASMMVVNGQAIVTHTDGSVSVIDSVGTLANTSTVSGMIPTGAGSMAWVSQPPDYTNAVMVGGTSAIWELYISSPDSLFRTTSSSVGVYTGSWAKTDLMERNKVSALTVDVSGHIFATVTSNELYKIAAGSIVSGYPYTIFPPTNQEEGVPLGCSRLLYWNSNLYASTSLNGGLIKVGGL